MTESYQGHKTSVSANLVILNQSHFIPHATSGKVGDTFEYQNWIQEVEIRCCNRVSNAQHCLQQRKLSGLKGQD